MKQLVPVRKQSKKAQRSFFAQKRGSWMGLNPVTRTVQSRKAYDETELSRQIAALPKNQLTGNSREPNAVSENTRDSKRMTDCSPW